MHHECGRCATYCNSNVCYRSSFLFLEKCFRSIQEIVTKGWLTRTVLGPSFLDKKLRKKGYSPSFGLVRVAQVTEEAGQQSKEKQHKSVAKMTAQCQQSKSSSNRTRKRASESQKTRLRLYIGMNIIEKGLVGLAVVES